MKKRIYIILFTLLGLEIQFLVHAWIEIWYIDLLLRDFEKYSFGLSWRQWFLIHHVASAILLIAGIALGFWQGKYWWRRIYEKNNLKR